MSESKQQSLPPGYLLEEFEIIRVLGSGGFGITYLAHDQSLDREVVIKENLPLFAFRDPSTSTVHPKSAVGEDKDLFEWSLESFVREARTLAKFDHPNIVKILRIFHANNTAYFVMPYVQGETFSEWITERKKAGRTFAEEELGALLLPLLEALDILHGQHVYHRDIKPGNVLVTSRGTPMLIDFGAARQMVSVRSHTVVESPGFTPFEQLQSRGNVGPWSDLYGLAATFYKALTFENPPKAADRVKKDAIRKLGEDPELRGRYSRELLTSLDTALAFDEEDRPQGVVEWQSLWPRMGALPVNSAIMPVVVETPVMNFDSSEKKPLPSVNRGIEPPGTTRPSTSPEYVNDDVMQEVVGDSDHALPCNAEQQECISVAAIAVVAPLSAETRRKPRLTLAVAVLTSLQAAIFLGGAICSGGTRTISELERLKWLTGLSSIPVSIGVVIVAFLIDSKKGAIILGLAVIIGTAFIIGAPSLVIGLMLPLLTPPFWRDYVAFSDCLRVKNWESRSSLIEFTILCFLGSSLIAFYVVISSDGECFTAQLLSMSILIFIVGLLIVGLTKQSLLAWLTGFLSYMGVFFVIATAPIGSDNWALNIQLLYSIIFLLAAILYGFGHFYKGKEGSSEI